LVIWFVLSIRCGSKGFAQSELLRTKNDKVDAGLIARFCVAMNPGTWTPPPPEIRRLQSLVRRADTLIDIAYPGAESLRHKLMKTIEPSYQGAHWLSGSGNRKTEKADCRGH